MASAPSAHPVRRLPISLRRAAWTVIDHIFPPRCGGCRRLGLRFCEACQRSVVFLPLPVCARCGCPAVESEQGCWCQPAARAVLAGVRAAAYHEGPLRQAIHSLKYKHNIGLADSLGQLLNDCWLTHGLSADLLVPVPLSRQRLRQRGYNQAALLAGALAERTGVVVANEVLHRVRDTASQMGSRWGERWTNVTGAFAVPPGQAGRLAGCTVALVDDVCTTGATLTACAEALLQGGAREVWGVALARPRRNTETVVE